jgi:hypothetical protein
MCQALLSVSKERKRGFSHWRFEDSSSNWNVSVCIGVVYK